LLGEKINSLTTEPRWAFLRDKDVLEQVEAIKSSSDPLDKVFSDVVNDYYHHQYFFETITDIEPDKNKKSELLEKLIIRCFGSDENFINQIHQHSESINEGWLWVLVNGKTGFLEIKCFPHSETPVGVVERFNNDPIMILDFWEHSYVPDYHWDKRAYITAFLKHVNWPIVSKRLDKILDNNPKLKYETIVLAENRPSYIKGRENYDPDAWLSLFDTEDVTRWRNINKRSAAFQKEVHKYLEPGALEESYIDPDMLEDTKTIEKIVISPGTFEKSIAKKAKQIPKALEKDYNPKNKNKKQK